SKPERGSLKWLGWSLYTAGHQLQQWDISPKTHEMRVQAADTGIAETATSSKNTVSSKDLTEEQRNESSCRRSTRSHWRILRLVRNDLGTAPPVHNRV
ncbi:unnamed protein product, partial [Ascophyllum nodosum]